MRLQRAVLLFAVGLLVCGATTGLASDGDPEFRSAGSRQTTQLEEPCPANQFPPIQLAFASAIDQRLTGTTTDIRCQVNVANGGNPLRGVPITLGGELTDTDGNLIASLATKSKTTKRSGGNKITFPYSPPPAGEDIVVIVQGLLGGEMEIDEVDTTCSIVQRVPCRNSENSACLLGGRFKVGVDSADGGAVGMVKKATKRQALFYFFDPADTDVVVEVLNQCSDNRHFWVFAAASTGVDFELTVTDTLSGESRAYNDVNRFAPIQDTAAFATCP